MKRDSSSLAIMNEERKVYSTRRDDLDHILGILSIRLDNPLNYLTQEQSKKFLNVSKPELLYSFFMKGTEMEDMRALHKEAEENAKSMKEAVEKVEGELCMIERDLKGKASELETLQNLKHYEKRLAFLGEERKWSILQKRIESITSMDKELLERRREMSNLKRRRDDLEKEIGSKTEETQKIKLEEEETKK
jgi:chromosome segregation ATPase